MQAISLCVESHNFSVLNKVQFYRDILYHFID